MFNGSWQGKSWLFLTHTQGKSWLLHTKACEDFKDQFNNPVILPRLQPHAATEPVITLLLLSICDSTAAFSHL